jgi:hypothetical protein
MEFNVRCEDTYKANVILRTTYCTGIFLYRGMEVNKLLKQPRQPERVDDFYNALEKPPCIFCDISGCKTLKSTV